MRSLILILFSFWGSISLAQYGGSACSVDAYPFICEAVNGGSYHTIQIPGCSVSCPPYSNPVCEPGSFDSKYCSGRIIMPYCQCIRTSGLQEKKSESAN